jgi:hypothetical protein
MENTFFKLASMGTNTEEVLSAALMYMAKISHNKN